MVLKFSLHTNLLIHFKGYAGIINTNKKPASPYQHLYEKILNTAFGKHTYKHTTMGFFTDVVDMPNQYDYSLTFFERFYRPEYTTVIVVGDESRMMRTVTPRKTLATGSPVHTSPP